MTQNKCSNKVFSSSYVNPYSCKIYRNTEILSNLPSSNSNLNRLNSEVQSKDQPYPKIQFKGYLDNLPSSEFQSLVLGKKFIITNMASMMVMVNCLSACLQWNKNNYFLFFQSQ